MFLKYKNIIITLILLLLSTSVNASITVDPNTIGTTTAGIQEAIDSCPPEGCEINLPCLTYPITSIINLDNKHNISFKGESVGCTIIDRTENISASGWQGVISLINGSSNIHFEDITFRFFNTCQENCLGKHYNVNLGNEVKDITFNKVNIEEKTYDSAPPWARYNLLIGGRYFDSQGEQHSNIENIRFNQCVFKSSNLAFEIHWGKDVIVTDSLFVSQNNDGSDLGIRQATMLYKKYLGIGNKVQNSTFNMRNEGQNYLIGAYLLEDVDNQNNPSIGVKLIGNTFYNIENDSEQHAIRLHGYNDAQIIGNDFQCRELDCIAHAVWMTDTANCNDCNQGNMISCNHFLNFRDDNITAPIRIESSGDDNINNIITGNVFRLSDITEDGVAGQAQSNYGGNVVLAENTWIGD